jgi:hypothetical protein
MATLREIHSLAVGSPELQDSLFVASGAALAVAIRGDHERLFLVAVLAAVIGLGLGVWARIKEGGDE